MREELDRKVWRESLARDIADGIPAQAAWARRYGRLALDLLDAKCAALERAEREANERIREAGRLHSENAARWKEALEKAERERDELRNKLDALADAASMVCYCPSAGGYYEGASVEDTFEKLQEALDDHYGFQLDIDVNEWYTEEEMRKRRLRGGDDE